MEVGVEWLTGDDGYYQQHRWPMALVAITLSAALFVLVERWEPRQARPEQPDAQPNPIVAPAGGPIQVIKRRRANRIGRAPSSGSFFFIPLRWWRWLLLATAIGLVGSEVIT